MSQSSSSVTNQPTEDHRARRCECGLLVREYTSRRKTSYGLRFITCPKRIDEQCPFFEWIDDLVCIRCAGTITTLRERIRENEATIVHFEGRIVDLLVSEKLLQLSLEEQKKSAAELQLIVENHKNTESKLQLAVKEFKIKQSELQLSVEENKKTQAEMQAIIAECGAQARAAEDRIHDLKKKLKCAFFLALVLFVVLMSIGVSRFKVLVPSPLFQLGV